MGEDFWTFPIYPNVQWQFIGESKPVISSSLKYWTVARTVLFLVLHSYKNLWGAEASVSTPLPLPENRCKMSTPQLANIFNDGHIENTTLLRQHTLTRPATKLKTKNLTAGGF